MHIFHLNHLNFDYLHSNILILIFKIKQQQILYELYLHSNILILILNVGLREEMER